MKKMAKPSIATAMMRRRTVSLTAEITKLPMAMPIKAASNNLT